MEIRDALPVVRWVRWVPSSQNMDTGAALQTLLTEVKLHMNVICDADYTSFVTNEGKGKSTS